MTDDDVAKASDKEDNNNNDGMLQTCDFFVTFRHALFVPLFVLCLLSLYSLFIFVYSRSRALRTPSISHVTYLLSHAYDISHVTYLLSHAYDISHVNHYHMPTFYHMLLYLPRL